MSGLVTIKDAKYTYQSVHYFILKAVKHNLELPFLCFQVSTSPPVNNLSLVDMLSFIEFSRAVAY